MTIPAKTAEAEVVHAGTVPIMEHLAICEAMHLVSQQTVGGTSGIISPISKSSIVGLWLSLHQNTMLTYHSIFLNLYQNDTTIIE